MTETSILRCSDFNYCEYGTNERKLAQQLRQYVQDYPDQVQIVKENEDGYIYAHIPYNWFKGIRPPTKRNLTDEQRKELSDRMKNAREVKKNKNNT